MFCLQTILEREAERRDTDNEIRARSGTHVPLENITLDDITIMGTLGTGTFGTCSADCSSIRQM